MKPILFNTEMVKAILDGRKTVTRRVLADGECFDKRHGLDREPYKFKTGEWRLDKQTAVDDYKTYTLKSPYQPGDILYVRETWKPYSASSAGVCEIEYKAGGKVKFDEVIAIPKYHGPWRPSIHMPKEAARIFLRVTNIRAERLQDITYEGCKAEGFDGVIFKDDTEGLPAIAIHSFSRLWNNTIKKKEQNRFGWDANPWVWVIEFERISREEATSEEITL